ncbi:MAG: oligosaccharide flippase family protein [Crocinitomix sp.]|nr:oligosaccharide flippase family protein [Crocinitomix sp.]
MGIIQKQALRTTVISFLGIGIGVTSQLLFAVYLTKTEIGALSLLNSISNVIAIIFCLGFAQITFQVFSNFRNEHNGHSGFLIFGLIFSLIGVLTGEITFYIFQDVFVGTGDEQKLIRSLVYLIFPIIFFRIFFRNLDVYLRMLFSSVTGAFLEGILLKLIVLLGIVLFWLGWVDYEGLAYVYTIALCIPGLIIIFLAIIKTQKLTLPKKELFDRATNKKMFNFGIFGIIAATSGVIIITIDQLMLNQMVGTDAVGLYSVIFFAAALIGIPSRGIKRIAVPVFTESWKTDDLDKIDSIYRKSVINQTVIAVFLFLVGWACFAPALTFLPKYEDGLYVFFFLGLGQLFDMMTGLNMEVVLTSKRYKVNTYFNIVLALLVITLNYFFISEWQVLGAAAASALAIFAVNLGRWYYLKRVYGLQPFDKGFAKIVLIGVVLTLFISFVELPIPPFWLILTYVFGITIIYWTLILKFNLAPDMREWLLKMKRKFISKN